LSPERVRQALEAMVARHPALRIRFAVDEHGEPFQELVDVLVDLPLVELDDVEALRGYADAQAKLRIDLDRDMPWRAVLLRVGDAESWLVFCAHHLIMDGWSIDLLLDTFVTACQGEATLGEDAFTASPLDHAAWTRAQTIDDSDPSLAYWVSRLDGVPPLDLSRTRAPRTVSTAGGSLHFELPPSLAGDLDAFCRRERCTPYMVLLAAYAGVLHRYSAQTAIAIGSPTARRDRPECLGTVGCFVDTVVQRVDLAEALSFKALVEQVSHDVAQSMPHQHVPLERIVRALQPGRELGRSPVFQAMLSVNQAVKSIRSIGDAPVETVPLSTGTAKLDLSLTVLLPAAPEAAIACVLEYSAQLFDVDDLAYFPAHLENMLTAGLASPDLPVGDLPMLADQELARLEAFSATPSWEEVSCTVLDAFVSSTLRDGDAVAISCGQCRLTYARLDAAANAFAARLMEAGVGLGDRVGLLAGRSIEAAVALLGILKSGAAYVPMDPKYPPERLSAIVRASAPRLLACPLPQHGLDGVQLPMLWPRLDDALSAPPVAGPPPSALAYIIHTSGSTGVPKGVGVTHEGLARYLASAARLYMTGAKQGSLVHSSLSFDLTVTSLFLPWLRGGSVHLLADEASLDELARALCAGEFGLVKMTPSHLEALQALLGPTAPELRVGTLVLGGEALHEAALEWWRKHAPGATIINEYGPTEAIVGCSVHDASRPGQGTEVPIGRPLPGVRLYVLDPAGERVPLGVPGELYIGGRGLATGYFGRGDLTAASFLPDPWTAEPGARMYRTGDRVCSLADGSLVYLGRLDRQVKVRGFRIEPGQVEAVMLGCPGVERAVVVLRRTDHGDARLVGYYTCATAGAVDPQALATFLRARLPSYEVPAALGELDELPLTVHGKLDESALPEVSQLDQETVAPRNAIESVLSQIWAQAEVLDVEGVGIHDNFFDLGGHSLLATRVMSRVREAFDVELPLRSLFEAPTVAGMAERVGRALGRDDGHGGGEPALAPRSPTEQPVMSYAQRRLWFLAQLDPTDAAYHVPVVLSIRGDVDMRALAASVADLAERQHVLRTAYVVDDGEPIPTLRDMPPGAWADVDLSCHADPEGAADAWIATAAREPFDLAAGEVLRVRLLKLGDAKFRLVLCLHHIVVDGWGLGVLLDEIKRGSDAHRGVGKMPGQPPVQYADWAAWERKWLASGVSARQLEYWKRQLADLSPIELPTDRPRPVARSSQGAIRAVALEARLTHDLLRLARREGVTPFMLLLAAFQALLARYGASADVAVGSPVANRRRTELEGLVGFFSNTLVLRTNFEGRPTVRELLARVRRVCLDAYANQELPFERLVEELVPERDMARTPLFQVMFALQNAPFAESGMAGLELDYLPVDTGTAKFDLSLSLQQTAAGLVGTIEYSTELFDAETVDRLFAHYRNLLLGMVEDSERLVDELPLLGEHERRASTPAAIVPDGPVGTLHERFASIAAVHAGNVAATHAGVDLTYGELDRLSEALAIELRAAGVVEGQRVAVDMAPSLEMLVALLATLKAGGAYVPLDPDYPDSRRAFILDDARPSVCLVASALVHAHALPVIRVDLDRLADAAGGSLPDIADECSLAYIIHTSGSTGTPKGVGVEHRQVVRLFNATASSIDASESDTWTFFHSFAFDFSVWEIWGAWLTGGRVLVVPRDMARSAEAFHELVCAERVSVLSQTPGAFAAFIEAQCRTSARHVLRHVVLGGEALDLATLTPWWEDARNTDTRITNMYGITETTVHVTHCRITRETTSFPGRSPIGRPLDDLSLYVLDRHMQPVPDGVVGELYVGGAGVSRGYVKLPDATAERFVPDPFSARAGGRLYRTGDTAQRMPDGCFRYVGRADRQLKLRGYRIEPVEVEAALCAHPEVRLAAVAVRQLPAGTQLVGYVAASPREGFEESLRQFVAVRLPAYEVPAVIVAMEELPLTDNGKVDRQRLPVPAIGTAAPATPVRETEVRLHRIWADVLGLATIDTHANFFALGGHSLLATRLLSRVRSAFGVSVPLRALFDAPTITTFARSIDAMCTPASAAEKSISPRTAANRDELPVSLAQRRMYFMHRLAPEDPSYNVPLALGIRGPYSTQAWQAAIDGLLDRHEVLRAGLRESDGELVAFVDDQVRVPLIIESCEATDMDARAIDLARRPFDLAVPPLMRATLLAVGEEEALLVLVLHHAVVDGWSLPLLLRDLAAFHDASVEGTPAALPPLPVQYADYAAWQADRRQQLLASRERWRKRLAGFEPLALPYDAGSAPGASFAAPFQFELPPTLVARLKTFAHQRGATPFMVLLTAFDVLLARYTDMEDISVVTPVANRGSAETHELVGFFVNSLILRTRLDGMPDFESALERVLATCVDALADEDMPYEALLEDLAVDRTPGTPGAFPAMFAYQDLQDARPSFKGLAVEARALHNGTSKFALAFNVTDHGRQMTVVVEYAPKWLKATTIERMGQRFASLLQEALEKPDLCVWDLELDRAPLPAPAGFAHERDILGLFDRQARTVGSAAALRQNGHIVTFTELSERSQRLANQLQNHGVGRGDPVGLCVERSVDMVVAMLAVLRIGAHYVPLEPDLPEARIGAILAEVGATVMLTQWSVRPRLAASASIEPIYLDLQSSADESDACAQVHTVEQCCETDLAYVIYTSGSTGVPKGVMVTRGGLAAYAHWASLNYGPADAIVHTSLAFDLTLTAILVPLLNGSCVELLDAEADIEDLADSLLRSQGNLLLKATPAHLAALAAHPQIAKLRRKVRTLVVGGDILHHEPVQAWLRDAPATRIVNEYGPTETVVGCAVHWAASSDTGSNSVPIGKAIDGARLHVLDSRGRIAPPGTVGELYVGGAGVARGYVERPDLTAERFVPDPFSGEHGARLYRTGDRVRELDDGALEYLGRIDRQVKIRGYRIEPAEIEAALLGHPAVSDVVVLAEGDGLQLGLVAFLAPLPGYPRPETPVLMAHLRERLPRYAIPSRLHVLDTLPLTANGKVDHKALLGLARETRVPSVLPQTPTQHQLAEIWRDVLGSVSIGIHDDFFELGGHSLLATRVVSRVRQAFDVELPLRSVFEEPTIAGMARRVEEALGVGDRASLPVEAVPREGPLPLSYAQRRLWFLSRLEPDSAAYNVPFVWSLEGDLDARALEGALDELVARHEVLRTRVVAEGDEPMQVIDVAGGLPLERHEALDEQSAEAWAREVVKEGFDLSRGPLCRAWLVSLPQRRHWLVLSMHHIVIDNWAVGVLLKELSALYRKHRGEAVELAALPVQYADYASWQRRWMDGEASSRQLTYWSGQLAGVEPLSLPTDRPRPAVQGSRGAVWSFELSSALVKGLSRLSRREGATMFMSLLAGFQAVLGRYAGTEDVAVGSPVANRNRAEIEGLIGFFVNTLVLRSDLGGDPGFAELVRRVRRTCLEAYAHQDLPFEKLVEELQPDRDLSRTPLFQVLFALQNAHDAQAELAGLVCTPVDLGTETSKFDLNLSLQERGGTINGTIEYNPDLFDEATIARFGEHYRTLLEAAVEEPERAVGELPLSGVQERAWLAAWNASADATLDRRSVVEQVAAQAQCRPAALAVRDGRGSLDFGALEAASDRVARALVSRGIAPEQRVGLWLGRSVELVVALLGVLKAGAAYVPLDPAQPPRRLAAMAEAAGVALVIGDGGAGWDGAWLPVSEAMAHAGNEALPGPAHPLQLAYVMYTSGSTGAPKGTMVTHGGLSNYLSWASRRYLSGNEAGEGSVVHSSLSFDLTVTSLLVPLVAGRNVRLLDAAAPVDELGEVLKEEVELGLLKLTPAHLEVLEQTLGEAGPRARVGTLVIGGEALHESRLAYWRGHAPGTELVNEYGPTETVVGCCVYASTSAGGEGAAVPIGRPIGNLTVHVLDERMQAVPAGVAGEIYIGGAGVARGYLGRPDLTAERFVPDPFCERAGERLYRTGDRARLRGDGELEYLGRMDEQLKLRGYRLEPGEVEAALTAVAGITQAAVGVRERADGDRRLVAWYATADGAARDADSLRAALRDWLPDYAIPVHYHWLAALPLTANGKVDRRALPAPSESDLAGRFVAPRTEVESRLSDIWAQAEVLGLDKLGIHDDFFELGGHSLLATRVVSRVRQAFDVELPLRSVFEEPTIAGMARRVEEALGVTPASAGTSIRPADRSLPLPLSHAQQRLWFLHRMDPSSAAYTVPLGMHLSGPLNAGALAEALSALAQRHELLRTRFVESAGQPRQCIDDAAAPVLECVDLSGAADPSAEAVRKIDASLQVPFDLQHGPLLRAHLYCLSDQEHQLVFTMHHIVLDGWSVGILLQELDALYRSACSGVPAGLPTLPVQYADYATWQRQNDTSALLESQLAYWREQLAGLRPLDLPTSHPRRERRGRRGGIEPFVVPDDLVTGLRRVGRREGATLFMGLLAGFVAILHRYTGADSVAVGTPVAGRTRAEIEGLIGFFVNTLVLRNELNDATDARSLLAQVRQTCLDAFANQDVPFERLVEELQPERDLSRTPLFQVMFSLNDVSTAELPFAGLDTRFLPLHTNMAKFDLNMHLDDRAGAISGIVEYDRDLFDPDWIRAFIGHFLSMLRSMTEEAETPVAHMPMLSARERDHFAELNRPAILSGRASVQATWWGCICPAVSTW